MKGSVNVPGASVADLNKHTNNQTPTFTQAETLENISSGEKMSTIMGKIMKAIADLITHLADKNNPHEVSPEGIGMTTETWTFTLEDGSTTTKAVYVG